MFVSFRRFGTNLVRAVVSERDGWNWHQEYRPVKSSFFANEPRVNPRKITNESFEANFETSVTIIRWSCSEFQGWAGAIAKMPASFTGPLKWMNALDSATVVCLNSETSCNSGQMIWKPELFSWKGCKSTVPNIQNLLQRIWAPSTFSRFNRLFGRDLKVRWPFDLILRFVDHFRIVCGVLTRQRLCLPISASNDCSLAPKFCPELSSVLLKTLLNTFLKPLRIFFRLRQRNRSE